MVETTAHCSLFCLPLLLDYLIDLHMTFHRYDPIMISISSSHYRTALLITPMFICSEGNYARDTYRPRKLFSFVDYPMPTIEHTCFTFLSMNDHSFSISNSTTASIGFSKFFFDIKIQNFLYAVKLVIFQNLNALMSLMHRQHDKYRLSKNLIHVSSFQNTNTSFF